MTNHICFVFFFFNIKIEQPNPHKTRPGKRSFTRQNEQRIWFCYRRALELGDGSKVDYNKIAKDLQIPGRDGQHIRKRIKNIKNGNKALKEKLDEEYERMKLETQSISEGKKNSTKKNAVSFN